MENMAILEWLNERTLGAALPFLLLSAGLLYAILLRGAPFFHPIRTLLLLKGKTREETRRSLYGLCMALSGTLGVGNISGVALAIAFGGAGSIFWMWVSALLAMLLKYAEILLALTCGREGCGLGAMGYMKQAFRGRLGGVMAALFALLCVLLAFLLGGLLQANAISECLSGFFGTPPLWVGVLLALLAALVIFGGEGRIGRVTAVLVPLLTLSYFLLSVWILLRNAAAVPSAFGRIFASAMSGEAALGGGLGFLFSKGLRYGVARGLLSNEAGCGTAPLAHATAKTDPVKQGIMGMMEVFVDTILLCTVTALVILVAFEEVPTALGGALVAVLAYGRLAGEGASVFVAVALVLFAYGTVICWAYYGEKGIGYLCGERPFYKRAYFFLFCLSLFGGCFFSSAFVWGVTDTLLSLMTLSNLAALLLLAPTVVAESRRGGLFGKKGENRGKKAGVFGKSNKNPCFEKKYL